MVNPSTARVRVKVPSGLLLATARFLFESFLLAVVSHRKVAYSIELCGSQLLVKLVVPVLRGH